MAIDEEVKKLTNTNFIIEVKHLSWLANIVFIRNASNKWCMGISFTDFNVAYPKDPYPLTNINPLGWLI